MGTTVPPKPDEEDDKASFGSGLGVDLKPLDKRILVSKARDAKPLNIKRQRTDSASDR